jgi:hypothetical protein
MLHFELEEIKLAYATRCPNFGSVTHVVHEFGAPEAVARLDELRLSLPLIDDVPRLQLLDAGPINLVPSITKPGRSKLG